MKSPAPRPAAAVAAALALALSFAACSGGDKPDKPADVAVRGVAVSPPAIGMAVGGPGQALTAALDPPDATNQAVEWASTPPGVVSIEGTGLRVTVGPLAEGTATITVTTADGGRKASCTATVVPESANVPVAGVSLSPAAMDLTVGDGGPGPGRALAATIAPAGATNKGVDWASSPPGVVSIAGGGLDVVVSPVAEGAATITVTTADGGFTDACAVTVTRIVSSVPVTGVGLSPGTLDLNVGGAKGTLTASVAPPNASNQGVSWQTSAQGVATVAGSGPIAEVTAVANGTARITVATDDGGHTAVCDVTVRTPATGVALNKNAMTLAEGDSETLVATVAPPTASNPGVSWQTSDPGVATVAPSGQACQIAGVGVGTATITVATLDGGHTAACIVTVERGEPLPIRGATIAAAYPSGNFCLAIKDDGTLWGWGEDAHGQLGQGIALADGRPSPVQVGTAANWAAVAAGRSHSLAINAYGQLWAWGRNNYGQVGRGGTDTSSQLAPVRIGSGSDWVAVSAGAHHSLGLRLDGSLWAWGRNDNGQLGNRDTLQSADQFQPVRVGGPYPIDDVASVAAGGMFSLAVKADGTLWGWGLNSGGQLALGSGPNATQTQYGPVQEASHSTDWAAVSGGGNDTGAGGHVLAVRSDGGLWAWGRTDEGKLGDNGAAPTFAEGVVTTPFRLGTATDWTAASAGSGHSMAVKNGEIWGWGGNTYGGVGTGGTAQQNVPVRIGADGGWEAVAAGNNITIALKANGELWAWGWNNFGQLGLGYFSYTEPELLPVKVGGGFMVPAR
jgi:uncharacterized protein YjdB/alpha-tubulin suppressor-like RCC1 family protein